MKKALVLVFAGLAGFSTQVFSHELVRACNEDLATLDAKRVLSDLQQMQAYAAARVYTQDIHRRFLLLAREALVMQARSGSGSEDFTALALSVIEASRRVHGEVLGRFVTTVTDVGPVIRSEAARIGLRASEIKQLKQELFRSYVPGQLGRRLYTEVRTWDWGTTAEARTAQAAAQAEPTAK